MELKLENVESKKTQELANLIRAYNRLDSYMRFSKVVEV